jgi:hypothetical protein
MNRRILLLCGHCNHGRARRAGDGAVERLRRRRTPTSRIESADKKFFGTHFPALPASSGLPRGSAGPRVQPSSARAIICSSATSPTTG